MRPLIVVELGESYDGGENDIARIEEKLLSRFSSNDLDKPLVVVVPHDVKVYCLPNGSLYHREKLGEYEITIIANSEKELRERLELVEYFENRK